MTDEKKPAPKKRNTTVVDAEKRQSSARLKISGWNIALGKNLVNLKYKTDIDVQHGHTLVLDSESNATELKNFCKDHESQIKSKKEILKLQRQKILSDARQKKVSAAQKRNEAVRIARENFKNEMEQIKNELALQLQKLKAEYDKLKLQSNEKEKMQKKLNSSHAELELYTSELNGIILAAFPGKKNREIRRAIERGDEDFLRNL